MTLIRGPRGNMCTIRQAQTGDSVRVSVYFDGDEHDGVRSDGRNSAPAGSFITANEDQRAG